ncbi:hypothetical protein MAH1_21670 [Sessilibacter sp. MAH1]
MSTVILKDVLIQSGKINQYFEGAVPVNLWRARNKKTQIHVFDFVEKNTVLSNGRPRLADIQIVSKNGVKWVSVKYQPRGISTFDEPGLPKGKDWEYYRIPKGTELPNGLAIVKDQFNTKFQATHYTIAPAYDMPLSQFKNLLHLLAQRIIKEAI